MEEVKGAVGIKDRLKGFTEAVSHSENAPVADPEKVQERLAEVKGVGKKPREVSTDDL